MRLPVVSGKDLIKALEKKCFKVRRRKGSHIALVRDDPPARLTVPDHREIKRGTLSEILRQSGLGRDDFLDSYSGIGSLQNSIISGSLNLQSGVLQKNVNGTAFLVCFL